MHRDRKLPTFDISFFSTWSISACCLQFSWYNCANCCSLFPITRCRAARLCSLCLPSKRTQTTLSRQHARDTLYPKKPTPDALSRHVFKPTHLPLGLNPIFRSGRPKFHKQRQCAAAVVIKHGTLRHERSSSATCKRSPSPAGSRRSCPWAH